jgi:hypothetical protein
MLTVTSRSVRLTICDATRHPNPASVGSAAPEAAGLHIERRANKCTRPAPVEGSATVSAVIAPSG